MKKILFTLSVILLTGGITFSQTEKKETPKKETDRSINHDWQEAIKDAEEALRNIEIPDIDVDQIMEEVKDAMPTREEIEDYKHIVAEAMGELKNIDLTGLEEALEELRKELGDIFSDNPEENNGDKKDKDEQ